MSLRRFPTRGEIRGSEGTSARDHLANERTFLSWVRACLACIGLGGLVAELVDPEGPAANALGVSLVVLGAIAAVASTARYLRVTLQLDGGRYQSSTLGPIVVGVVTLLVAAAGLVFALT